MTKKEMMDIVEKYGMEPLYDHPVTMQQIGFCLYSKECISELDGLAANEHKKEHKPVAFWASYTDGGRLGALYHIYCPKSFL